MTVIEAAYPLTIAGMVGLAGLRNRMDGKSFEPIRVLCLALFLAIVAAIGAFDAGVGLASIAAMKFVDMNKMADLENATANLTVAREWPAWLLLVAVFSYLCVLGHFRRSGSLRMNEKPSDETGDKER